MSDTSKIIHTMGRNNCGGRCLLHAHVQDGQLLKITTDCKEDAKGFVPLCACARGINYAGTYLTEDRLKYPMKRVGKRGEGKFERISWKEAIDTITSEWIRIRDTYGPGSRYVPYATAFSAVFSPRDMAKRLLALDGGFLDYYNSYSTACIGPATKLMYGTRNTGSSLSEWLNAKLLLLMGHNPSETKFDSETMYYLRKARDKGIPIIIIDPRMSDTVKELQAEWIPIRPATDAALCDAMAYVIWSQDLLDQDFLDRCCVGFDPEHMPEGADPKNSYLSYLIGVKDGIVKNPKWASKITGIPEETIQSLALRFANAKPAALIQGYGAQRHDYGEQSTRGGITLACMTGNVGIPGGWASGAADYAQHYRPFVPPVPNPYPMSIPSYLWTDAVDHGTALTELDGVKGGGHLTSDVKMILNIGGNCLVNQHGDINKTISILEDEKKCEFIVVSDLFMTSSAMYADILLPGVSFLESENLVVPWAYGEFIGYNNKVVEPLYEGRFEYDWLCEIAENLGLADAFTLGRDTAGWLCNLYGTVRDFYPYMPEFEDFKKQAVYRYPDTKRRIAFEDFRRDPKRYPLMTETGKVEIYSPSVARTTFKEYFPAIPGYVPPREGVESPLREKYPLQLIGWHTKRRCHSIHDNNVKLEKLDPQRLWMHPEDAASRGIESDDQILVYNDRGQTRIPVLVTTRIMPGVVALAQGSWYRPGADGIDTNGSINVLTSLKPTAYSRGNGQHTNLVEVTK